MTSAKTPAVTTKNATAWSGCDVAKAKFDAALAVPFVEHPTEQWRDLPHRSFARTPEGARDYLAWIDRALIADDGRAADGAVTLHMICEHTGRYSQELIDWLRAERPALRWTAVPPQRASFYARSLNAATKTDPIDARSLTQYGLERRPAGDEPIDPTRAELRDLSRYRLELVQARTAEKNRVQEPTASPLVRQMQNRNVAEWDRQIERLEKKMRGVLAKLPDLARDAELIQTIVGVGEITAIAIVAELGDLSRFATARKLSAFAGLAPRLVNSGASVHRKAHLSKAGDPRLRALLYMCAVSAHRHNPHMKAVYDRLTAEGKPPLVALGAIMRKLLVLMRALVISGQPYQRDYAPGGKTPENLGKTQIRGGEKCA
jgi:transposase